LIATSVRALPSELVLAGGFIARSGLGPDGLPLGLPTGGAFLTGLSPSGERRWVLAADAEPSSFVDTFALTEERIVLAGKAFGRVSVRDEIGSSRLELPTGVFVATIERP
jgi:hypothetical protein